MEKGTREGKGMEGKGIEGEGLWFWFSLAPLRLCAFAFISSLRSFLPRVLSRFAVYRPLTTR
jgi:hypothetical protein